MKLETASVEEKRMTFGQHLEELRRRMAFSLIGVAIAFVACFLKDEPLFRVMVWPHRTAMKSLSEAYEKARGSVQEALAKKFPDPKEHSFAERLIEFLKDRGMLREPFRNQLQVIRYPESFLASVKISLIFGLIFSAPWVLWQLWLFVVEGLYEPERRAVRTFFPLSVGLFAAGVLFGYFVMVPISLKFLGGWAPPETVEANFTLEEYLNLFFIFTLALGALFLLPVVMLVLDRVGILGAATYRRRRKYALLIIVLTAAVITPTGDPITLMLLAGPLYLLYELGILLLRLFPARAIGGART